MFPILIVLIFSFFDVSLAWHNVAKNYQAGSSHPPASTSHVHNHEQEQARLVMYVQTFKTPNKEPLSLLPLIEEHTKVTHVIVAALHLHEIPGEIRLNDDPLESPIWHNLWHEIGILRHNGIKVMALLGGAAGGTYKRLNGTDAQFYAYYNPLLGLIKRYHFDGLDIDIEEEVDIRTPIRLMTALRRDMGPDFIITMSPLASALSDPQGQNLSGFSYFDLDVFATMPGSDEKLISWYNGLFYGGFARGHPFFESCIKSGWEPSRIVMVVLDSPEDGQANGFVHIETLQETISDLRHMYPNFGGVGGWEYFDAGTSDWNIYQPWLWVKRIGQALFDPLRPNGVKHELREEIFISHG